MAKGTIVIRVYLRDWYMIRRIYKAEREESACSYFKRLAKYLENEKRK